VFLRRVPIRRDSALLLGSLRARIGTVISRWSSQAA
jgi:hypothetical protein